MYYEHDHSAARASHSDDERAELDVCVACEAVTDTVDNDGYCNYCAP
jgi:hypothetical protein